MVEESSSALWQPSQEQINKTNLHQFIGVVSEKLSLHSANYDEFHQWSVDNSESFWAEVWDYTEIKASVDWNSVLTNADQFPGATWFAGARFNFAENLLRNRSDRIAIVGRLENGSRTTLSYGQLYEQVEQCAAAMRSVGVECGDRVAGFMPNVAQTVVAMLATTSIGAIWSSCSPDFGINGVMDRFGQIKPKLLFGCNGYYYNGKTIDSTATLQQICDKIDSIEQLVVVPVIEQLADLSAHGKAVLFNDFLITHNTPELVFEQLPFNHPLYIMYSSGTTGVPKWCA